MDTNINTNRLFTKLPNIILYTYGDKEQSIIEQLGYDHKVVCVLDYLFSNYSSGNGLSKFTLEDMIVSCGYKPNPNKGRTNDIFKSILCDLKKLNHITSDVEFAEIKAKDFIKCKLNIDTSYNFSIMYEDVRNKLYSAEAVDISQLFTYYCYINARMHRRSKTEGVSASGGEYEYTYFGFEKVYDDLKITDKAIVKYNDVLESLDLIRYKNFGTCYYKTDKKATTRLTPNFYTIHNGDEVESESNLREGYKLFKLKEENQNKIFTDKPLVSDNRSIGGEKGALKKKEYNNTITEEEKVKLKLVEEIIDDTHGEKTLMRDVFKFMETSGENTPLSEYYSYDSESKGSDYLKIEQELGLIRDGVLSVDFEFYKEIMLEHNGKNTLSLKMKVMNHGWGEENPIKELFA